VGGQRYAPAALPPGKRPGTRCIGSWVGPRAGLDGCGKSRPPMGFDPQAFQPVAKLRQYMVVNVLHVLPPAVRPEKELLPVPAEIRG